MTLDLHNEEGRRVVRQLAARSDVLLENFRPGVMEKWGLGPADLKPDLVYARISGYGQSGPKAQLPGYASVCEAYGGFRWVPRLRPAVPAVVGWCARTGWQHCCCRHCCCGGC